MCARIVWNDSWMCGRTGSSTSKRGQLSSAVFGITLDTDLPACTILILRSAWTGNMELDLNISICLPNYSPNMRWKGKTWQKICGETSGTKATSSKSSLSSRSKSLAFTLLFGVPISVIKNCIWSATSCLFFLEQTPLSKLNWCWHLLTSPSTLTSLAKKAGKFIKNRIHNSRSNEQNYLLYFTHKYRLAAF